MHDKFVKPVKATYFISTIMTQNSISSIHFIL